MTKIQLSKRELEMVSGGNSIETALFTWWIDVWKDMINWLYQHDDM